MALDGKITAPSFDLIVEPWIPVIRDGRAVAVSLREAVVEAHHLDSLSMTDGPQFAGILRLLSALVMDVYGRPATDDDWHAMRGRGCFDADTLDRYVTGIGRNRFDLFDAERPFMQSAATPDEGKSVAEILPHVAVGNNPALFTPDTDKKPRSLTAPEAARGLVAIQAVALPNLGRAPADESDRSWAGVSFAGRAGLIGFVAPLGRTLFDTVLLNIPSGVNPDGDKPNWARPAPPPGRDARAATGMLDLLTWTPRRVRLIPDATGRVARIGFRGGDGLTALVNAHEPHTALRTSNGKGAGAPPAGEIYPRKHLPHTVGWRGLPTLLALTPGPRGDQSAMAFSNIASRKLPPDYPIGVASLFIEFGNMSAVYSDLVFDVYPLPARAFGPDDGEVREELIALVSRADSVRQRVRAFARRAAAAAFRESAKDAPNATAYAASIERRFTVDVDAVTRRVLAGLAKHPQQIDEGVAAWDLAVYDLATRYRDEVRRYVSDRALDSGDPYPYAEGAYLAAVRTIFPAAAEQRATRFPQAQEV